MFSYEPLSKKIKEKGLTLKDISKDVGLSESVLVCKMNNKEYISMKSLDRLCKALQCPVSDIIQWVDGEQKPSEKVNVNWEFVMSILKDKGISLNELSTKCRLDSSSLSHSKNRNSQLRKWTVKIMASVLDCKLDDLVKK